MPPRNSLKLRTRGKDDLIYLLSTTLKANPLTVRMLLFLCSQRGCTVKEIHDMMHERKLSKNVANKIVGELLRNGVCKMAKVRGNGTFNKFNVVYIDNEEVLSLVETITRWYNEYE